MSPLPIHRGPCGRIILVVWAAGGPAPIPLTDAQARAIAAGLIAAADSRPPPPPSPPPRAAAILAG